VAASYIAAPSLFILAAYIQLTDALTSGREVARAHTRLVSASPRARRAMAEGLIRPWEEEKDEQWGKEARGSVTQSY
jgi:hypothetical protein